MKLTKIRRIEGDVAALREELQEALGVEQKEVVINQLTKHIIVKVSYYLMARRRLCQWCLETGTDSLNRDTRRRKSKASSSSDRCRGDSTVSILVDL